MRFSTNLDKLARLGGTGYKSFMVATADLQQMSVPDKLRLMEALWDDLAGTQPELSSPAWHGKVLEERDRLTASGEESFIDWETARRRLRDELQ